MNGSKSKAEKAQTEMWLLLSMKKEDRHDRLAGSDLL